jgi:predicted RNA binding protein YcfA (HicA-like mRNA interferase family)
MPKLPVLKYDEVIKILEKVGFVFKRQKGSHKIFKRDSVGITVPCHDGRSLKVGTLKNIIRQADISVEELINLLAK